MRNIRFIVGVLWCLILTNCEGNDNIGDPASDNSGEKKDQIKDTLVGKLDINYDSNGMITSIFRSNPDEDEYQKLVFYENGKIKEVIIIDGAEWKEIDDGAIRKYNIQRLWIDSVGKLEYSLLTRDYNLIFEKDWTSDSISLNRLTPQ